MPFKSQAQRRLFYARPELHKYIGEYEEKTKGKLPERKRSKQLAAITRKSNKA